MWSTSINFNSIKVRLELMIAYRNIRCRYFNSIKVRLEPAFRPTDHSLLVRFQFHKGTIRTMSASGGGMHTRYFNSIKVRLEQIDAHSSDGDDSISIP